MEPDLALLELAGSCGAACPPYLGPAMWSCLTLLSTVRPLKDARSMQAALRAMAHDVRLGCPGSLVLQGGMTFT